MSRPLVRGLETNWFPKTKAKLLLRYHYANNKGKETIIIRVEIYKKK